jgi:hypothetical protein
MQSQKKNLREMTIIKVNVPYANKNTTISQKYFTWRK